jgi:hypothetical protein
MQGKILSRGKTQNVDEFFHDVPISCGAYSKGRTLIAPTVLGFFLNFSRKPLSESRLRNFAQEDVQRTMRQFFREQNPVELTGC